MIMGSFAETRSRARRGAIEATAVARVSVSKAMVVIMVLMVSVVARGVDAGLFSSSPSAVESSGDSSSDGGSYESGMAYARRVRALPVGPCPLAPLAICEKLRYVVIEEEASARDAARQCDALGTGRKFLCALRTNAFAAVSKAVNWGDAMFPREARVVPLFGKRSSASREPSYDHALASLCDLRMHKLCGNVVEQRFEHASKQAEMMSECEVAEKLHDAWEVQKEMCEAKALEIKQDRQNAEIELKASEEAYSKKFGVKIGEKEKTKTILGCRSEAFGDKPTNDDMLISSLRETRVRLMQTQSNGGYCNKAAVDKLVNSKTAASRAQALKDLVLPGKYFETCEKVLSHLDFMINLLESERCARSESQGIPCREWCTEDNEKSAGSKQMKTADKDALEKRKKMASEASKISRKRQKHEAKQLEMMEKLRAQCTTQLTAAQKMYLQSLERCEAHGPRLRQLREAIINVESRVESIVPALDQTIAAVAIVGVTPDVAKSMANVLTTAELAKFAHSSPQELQRALGAEPLKTLRDACSASAILGAGGGKSDKVGSACPNFQAPGPISCSQSCAAMEAATIGRSARRDKPFSLGVIAGLALGYILFAKFSVHEFVNDVANASKDKRE